ncbi:hypothetical protein QBC39DRAFT_366429 [Podospora conica]|nr:hypothetical protein QBC39DRAFT_366429 [Schizothecium conicum]
MPSVTRCTTPFFPNGTGYLRISTWDQLENVTHFDTRASNEVAHEILVRYKNTTAQCKLSFNMPPALLEAPVMSDDYPTPGDVNLFYRDILVDEADEESTEVPDVTVCLWTQSASVAAELDLAVCYLSGEWYPQPFGFPIGGAPRPILMARETFCRVPNNPYHHERPPVEATFMGAIDHDLNLMSDKGVLGVRQRRCSFFLTMMQPLEHACPEAGDKIGGTKMIHTNHVLVMLPVLSSRNVSWSKRLVTDNRHANKYGVFGRPKGTYISGHGVCIGILDPNLLVVPDDFPMSLVPIIVVDSISDLIVHQDSPNSQNTSPRGDGGIVKKKKTFAGLSVSGSSTSKVGDAASSTVKRKMTGSSSLPKSTPPIVVDSDTEPVVVEPVQPRPAKTGPPATGQASPADAEAPAADSNAVLPDNVEMVDLTADVPGDHTEGRVLKTKRLMSGERELGDGVLLKKRPRATKK